MGGAYNCAGGCLRRSSDNNVRYREGNGVVGTQAKVPMCSLDATRHDQPTVRLVMVDFATGAVDDDALGKCST